MTALGLRSTRKPSVSAGFGGRPATLFRSLGKATSTAGEAGVEGHFAYPKRLSDLAERKRWISKHGLPLPDVCIRKGTSAAWFSPASPSGLKASVGSFADQVLLKLRERPHDPA